MKDGEKNMAYKRGSNQNIIVGAAALFVSNHDKTWNSTDTAFQPAFAVGTSYKESCTNSTNVVNVGYTSNGIDISFNPTFGDVVVDQLLDVAKLFKSGMTVTLRTSFAEASLENLLLALGQRGSTNAYTTQTSFSGTLYTTTPASWTVSTGTGLATLNEYIDLTSGELGDYPVERSLVAIGPGVGLSQGASGGGQGDQTERVYIAYRVVSISNVTVSAKRDAATMFDVEFRLLPDDLGTYGRIIDRTF
jgi:hypothetical protein